MLVPRLPRPVAAWIFRTIADLMWRRQGKSVLRLQSNYARVLGLDPADPRVRRLGRAGVRSYFRYWMEALRLPAMSEQVIVGGMHSIGDEVMFKHLDSGRGAIMALPHMGNWDQAGAWLVYKGYPFTTVQERLKPESLFERFVAYREGLGMEVLPLTRKEGGSARAFGTLAQRLRAGRPVCLPADRDLTDSGVEVDFFGARTRMAPGPALLALQTGAALLPATLGFEGEGWGLRIHDEIPVPAEGTRQEKLRIMTQAMAAAFEEAIREHLEDWHMMQRLWLDDLEPRPTPPAGAPASEP